MNNFNPMLDYQRNQLMAQQAMIQNQLNQMNQSMQPQPQFTPYPQHNNQPQFFVRQVGSVDEAKGFPVDPNTMYFFLDTGNGKIYLKQLNTSNGKSDFYTYIVQEQVTPEKQSDPMAEINQRLSNIENIIGGVINGKSVSSNESNAESNGNDSATNYDEISKTKPANVSAGSTNGKRKE